MAKIETEEVFYRIQFSQPGDGDWYVFDGHTYESAESAHKRIGELKLYDYDLRVVKVTVTEEVVEEVPRG